MSQPPIGVIAQPPGTPPPPTYPAGVVAAGLQAVWDLRDKTDWYTGPLKTLPANIADLPAGAIVGSFNPGSDYYVRFTQDCDISGWAPGLYEFIADGCHAKISNLLLQQAGVSRFAETLNGGHLELVDFVFDGTGASDANHALINNATGCRLTTTNGKFVNAPVIFITNFGDLVRTGCLFGAFGTATDPSNHGECIKTDKGSVTGVGNLFDVSIGGPIGCGITGVEFWKADSGANIVVSLTDEIYTYPDSQPFLWTTQAGVNLPQTLDIAINNVCWKSGTDGYMAKDPTVNLHGTGFNLVTGAPFSFP